MKGLEIEAYKKGFYDGLDIKENFKYNIFGYDLTKLLDILGNYKEKETTQMTFNEAVELITENGKHNRNDAAMLVTKLEKLGLLKFTTREIKPLFKEYSMTGQIELETWSDMGLTLKINGKIVYQHNK